MKVLVVATHVWPLAARITVALRQVGFEVATVSPARSLVRTLQSVAVHFAYNVSRGDKSIDAAIRAWKPDLLVCTDDRAVEHLHNLHAEASMQNHADGELLVRLIETSLGNPASFRAASHKSVFMILANEAGVRCPRTWVIPAGYDDWAAPCAPYPILVKADGTFGGQGVRIVRSKRQAEEAIIELTLPANLPDRLKRPVIRSIFKSGIKIRRQRVVCLQEIVNGRPANRAVICHNGDVLAGLSVEALETQHELGPASIVRPIEHAEMAAIAKTMVSHLQLSGFVGFDFILDSQNNAWLIEMNPRVTPICHLRLADETSLADTIFTKMTGHSAISNPPLVNATTIVLFPGGLRDRKRSEHLSSIYFSSFHDVPWGEPELIRASVNGELSNSIYRQSVKALRRLMEELRI